jgi:hypothetical protein
MQIRSATGREFLEKGATVFSRKEDQKKQQLQETQEELFKKVGQQQYEIDWLKKTWRNWSHGETENDCS